MRITVLLIAISSMLWACNKTAGNEECNISKVIGTNSLSMYGPPDSSAIVIQYDHNRIVRSMEKVNPTRIYEESIEKNFEYSGEQLVKVRENNNGYETYYNIIYNNNNTISAINYSSGYKMNYFFQ